MVFMKAQYYDDKELVSLLEEEGLSPDTVAGYPETFFLARKDGDGDGAIIACGCYVSCLSPGAFEVRSVVTKPRNAILTKRIINYITNEIKKSGGSEAYALIDPDKLATYIEFLKKACGFEESSQDVSEVISRYKGAHPDSYENRVLLVKRLG